MTTTTTADLQAMSATALQVRAAASEREAIACLPAQILYVAAQFASRDEAKGVLQLVNVRRRDDGSVQIESTDGHRAFRFRVPVAARGGELWFADRDLKLNAATLRKRVSYGQFAIVRADGTVEFLGGKSKKGAPVPTEFLEARPWKHADDCYEFPVIDQLWPDSFTGELKGPIAFNARYVAEFMAEVDRYSHNGVVKLQMNRPTTPVVMTSSCELHGLEGSELEHLLMPVQIRG